MKKIVTIALLLTAASTYAGSAANGTLSNIHFMNNGVVMVYTSGARSNVPACATNQPGRFAIDGTTDAGKTQLSGLLAAYVAGKTVSIQGAGSCAAYPDTETINYFVIAG